MHRMTVGVYASPQAVRILALSSACIVNLYSGASNAAVLSLLLILVMQVYDAARPETAGTQPQIWSANCLWAAERCTRGRSMLPLLDSFEARSAAAHVYYAKRLTGASSCLAQHKIETPRLLQAVTHPFTAATPLHQKILAETLPAPCASATHHPRSHTASHMLLCTHQRLRTKLRRSPAAP